MAEEMFESTSVIPERPPLDILTSDGNPVESESGRMLSDIFSQVEQGKPMADAIKDKLEPSSTPEVKEVAKKEEAPEIKEKRPEAGSLGAKLDETIEKKTEEEEVTREALLAKTTPKKESTKTEPVKADAEKKEEKADPDAPSDDELQVLPHDKPKTAKRIQALLKKVDALNSTFTETKRGAEEKAKRLAELEEQLKSVTTSDPTTNEAIKAQLDELKMFKRRYELDRDPEVATKFDSRVQYAEKGITEILTKRQATPALLKLIADEGGWAKFSNSSTPISVKGADGSTTQIEASEAAENILAALPMLDRKQLESAMMEQIQIDRDKKRFLEEETARAADYFKSRDDESAKAVEVQQKGMEEAKKLIEEFKTTAVTQREWLKQQDIPATATPEQKAEIEDSNAYKKQLASLLKKNLEVKDIPSMLGVVEDSVAYYAERRNSARLLDENAKLRAELAHERESMNKFKNASRSTSKSGSLAGGGSTPTTQSKSKTPASLEDAFNRLEAGEKIVED
jgi:hypothetical protein